MYIHNSKLQISASDVAKHLACRHLTSLDLLAAEGELQKPQWSDPAMEALEQRGFQHEAAYIQFLRERGLEVLTQGEQLPDSNTVERTEAAMARGVDVIAQAVLNDGRWRGRADVLLKTPHASKLGNWSYEVVDTKLARETRGGTILQLCLYSELVSQIQGFLPEEMHVVSPGNQFQRESFRVADYLAYYRFVKGRLEREIQSRPEKLYPEPVEHCLMCDWWVRCNDQRRRDDHLSFVAGITKIQIVQLRKWGIETLATLAAMELPLRQKPERGRIDSYERIREQARLQFQYRNTGKPVYELLELEPDCGLARLPEPSAGDIFLDFESDPFVSENGLEYLLGYVTQDESYTPIWALDRTEERRLFESFIDFVMQRWNEHPGLHLYHFSPYEPAALKRLAGRYSTRQDELDLMLRGKLLIDLYAVVKQGLRGSVETYSLKDLEIFFRFQRAVDLKAARFHLRRLEYCLELADIAGITPELKATVEGYNRDDCVSTLRLRDWLESLRKDLDIPRPVPPSAEPSEKVDETRKRVIALMERLLANVSEDPLQRNPEQQAKWMLAQLLEWYRREEKVAWWEYFRLKELSDEELLEESAGISGLQFVKRVKTGRAPIDRYEFPLQETEVREGNSLETTRAKFGSVAAIDIENRTVDIKKRMDTADIHPTSVFAFDFIGAPMQAESLMRLGTWVADHGIKGPGKYLPARELLLRATRAPRLLQAGAPAVPEVSGQLSLFDSAQTADPYDLGDVAVLPVQGPPGAGKTFRGARLICSLIRKNKKVGITAVSHKVIRKLLDEVMIAAKELNLSMEAIHKVKDDCEPTDGPISEVNSNERAFAALSYGEVPILGGTAWLWARPEFEESVDFLFVDEAGQMSLADVLAVSQAAKQVVMLGDPQQLEQPLQGSHPPGVEVSALQYVLGDNKTMPPESGWFLEETWRLSPQLCSFTSELFYENRLQPHSGCELQKLVGSTPFAGAGLSYVPVEHSGNQNSSDEEVDVVAQIVKELLNSKTEWINPKGVQKSLSLDDILIVSPYNAQVFDIAQRLPGARVGTVDKFQGQEAPVVIYSMATSTPQDAPHGMEFLYSLNRFNVATSRARCACILVASPRLFEPECKTPRQMKLANVFCRYLEVAKQPPRRRDAKL